MDSVPRPTEHEAGGTIDCPHCGRQLYRFLVTRRGGDSLDPQYLQRVDAVRDFEPGAPIECPDHGEIAWHDLISTPRK